MRRVVSFPCEGHLLLGSLDHAPGTTGLLIVSGGNEPRMGAHRGMAMLAARIAAAGWPVFRFDRRGVGDSGGENGGWASSAADIAAAAAAFRVGAPQVTRLVGFGNCDAATALALFGKAAGIEALVLANPWVVERSAVDLPPPAAIRARYIERLQSPDHWRRLLDGSVDFRKLLRGLRATADTGAQNELANRFGVSVARSDARVILAKGDATAIAYADAARRLGITAPATTIATDSHSFARAGDMAAVERIIVDRLSA